MSKCRTIGGWSRAGVRGAIALGVVLLVLLVVRSWIDQRDLRRELQAGASPDVEAIEARVETQRSSRGQNRDARPWSVDQVLGEAETVFQGDQPTAWAPKDPDGGEEWLEVDCDREIVPDAIVIRETFNPGAVVRVEVVDTHGEFHALWRGSDPTTDTNPELSIPYELEIPTVFRPKATKTYSLPLRDHDFRTTSSPNEE